MFRGKADDDQHYGRRDYNPRVEPQAMDPQDSIGLYLKLDIWGNATVVMVAAVAVLDPQMAAKAAQAMMVAMAIPPRIWPTHLYAA